MNDKPVTYHDELRTEGLRCPEPIMQIRKRMWSMQAGEILFITADDPATVRDVPSYCRHMDHILLRAETESIPFRYWIKKGKG